MRRSHLVAATTTLLAAGACHEPTGVAAELSAVTAAASCAPADGPAVVFMFTPQGSANDAPVTTTLFLNVYRAKSDLAGRVYRFNGSNDAVGGMLYRSGAELSTRVTGQLRVDRVTATGDILAHADLRLPDGSHLRRAFVATWLDLAVLCG